MPFPFGVHLLPGALTVLLAFDVAIEPVARHVGVNPLLFFLPILAVETLVLWGLRWGNFVRAATGAFLMNAVTTLLGAALRLEYPDGFFYAFLLSFLVEGFILMLLARDRKLRSWLVALAANVVSYVLLFVLLVVLTMLGLILR